MKEENLMENARIVGATILTALEKLKVIIFFQNFERN
tara:strand:- start:105 stop:215 length:111 start_codon:yes stop_codon:yes gene_type:complete